MGKRLPTKAEIEHLSIKEVEHYLETLDFASDFTFLEGPFFPEAYAQTHQACYDILIAHHHNLIITRKLVLLAESHELFPNRDNECVKIGIDPHSHAFELQYNLKTNDFFVDGVDGLFLQNEADKSNLKRLIDEFPPTENELKLLLKT